MRLRRAAAGLLLFGATLLAGLLVAPLHAAGPEPGLKSAIVTLAPITGTRNVEMAAQIFDLAVGDAGAATVVTGVLTFKLHNTDKLTQAVMLLGFPAWGGGGAEWNDRSFSQFAVSVDGSPVALQPLTQPLKIGSETRNVRWLTFPMTLTEDDRGTVEVRLRQDLGDGVLPVVAMAQAPAINWKGFVSSARFTVRFPALTASEQFRAVTPPGSSFDGRAISWLFSDYNPDAPLVVQMIKPRLWREIAGARTALAQGPDARAALALGAAFEQLARTTQSAVDFAQAAAAYQRAAEVEPAVLTATLELARLYDARLRGDFGPVFDANGARAATLDQWRAVLKAAPALTEARDAVAQHAFVLAQAARRGGLFAGALELLDMARSANSARVTKAQIDAEARAANAGLVMQRLDAGQWTEALRMIAAEAIGPEANAERSAYQPQFNHMQATIIIAGDEQTISLRALPFPGASDAHRDLLQAYVDRVPSNGGSVSTDGDGYALTLRLPVGPVAAADLPAAPELALLRAVLSPPVLAVSSESGAFTSDERLDARYDLVETLRLARDKLAAIDRVLAALAAPSGDETLELARRVRLRALEQYRAGWQSLGATSNARVTWQAGPGASPQTWDVPGGQSQEIHSARETYQTTLLITVACLGVGGIGLLVTGARLWLARRRA